MYNPTRLEWHQGDEAIYEPRRVLCGLVVRQASLLISVNRLAVALAKSQDHRASCGVFAFGQRNAVRQWLRLRYPDTRLARSGNVGLVLERGGEIVWDSAMRWHGSEEQYIEAQANCGCDHGKAVLCSNIHQRAITKSSKVKEREYV
jgi:hypothetical protein